MGLFLFFPSIYIDGIQFNISNDRTQKIMYTSAERMNRYWHLKYPHGDGAQVKKLVVAFCFYTNSNYRTNNRNEEETENTELRSRVKTCATHNIQVDHRWSICAYSA